ncbi:MAG: CHRD domain-containing protein [Actinomycetota bacterium]
MRKTVAVVGLVMMSAVALIAFSVGRSTAAGGPKSYHAVLNVGQQETQDPQPDSTGIGVAHFVLHPDRTFCTNMTVIGLSSTINNAHIHGIAGPGSNTSPIIQLDPTGNLATGVWRNDCGTAFFGGDPDPKLTKAQVEALNKGKLYVNVHTVNHNPGEVRGQIHK